MVDVVPVRDLKALKFITEIEDNEILFDFLAKLREFYIRVEAFCISAVFLCGARDNTHPAAFIFHEKNI